MVAENSDTAARRRRGPGKPFQRGVSGNPGGRPRTIAAMQELAREATPAAVTALIAALDRPGERVAAARELLSRAWGSPVQMLATTTEGPQSILLLHLAAARGEPLRDALAPKHTPAALPLIESKAKGGEQPSLYEPALE